MNVPPKSASTRFPTAAHAGAAGRSGPHPVHENPGRRRDSDDQGRDDEGRGKGREDEAGRGGSGQRHPSRDEAKKDLPARGGEPRRGAMQAATFALCGGVAFALLAFVPGTPAQAVPQDRNADEADSAQPVTDSWITGKVKAELATTEGVKSLDISVTTVNGVVTLTGVQPTDLAVKKAVAAAKAVKGVKEVDASGLKAKS